LTDYEEACAAICLLTQVAWDASMPAPMTRLMVHKLKKERILRGSDLIESSGVNPLLFERAKALLSRASEVRRMMDVYAEQGYTIMTQKDDLWPKRLSGLPESQRPHVLFAKGSMSLLCDRKVAVAGSRDILPHTVSLARRAGQMLASEGLTMVSGCARGVDTAAQKGVMELGGRLILVPAKPVQHLIDCAELSEALEDGRLLILCDSPPDEHFSAQKAIARNHTIYALGDAALVVAARDGAGGSWRGATDCLRGGYTPLYTLEGSNDDMLGNAALCKLGAQHVDLLKPLEGQMFKSLQMNYLDMMT